MTIPVIQEEWPEFDFISNEVTSLWFELNLYKELFCGSTDTIYQMNHTAKHFFYTLSFILPTNITRVLATIYDKPKTGRNQNVTLESVCSQASMWCTKQTLDEIQLSLSTQKSTIGKLRKFRNKKLVHLDHGVATGAQIRGLTIAEMDGLATTAAETLNIIRAQLFDSHHAYQEGITFAPGDIIGCLKNSLWQKELRTLVRKREIDENTLPSLLTGGFRGTSWQSWCEEKNVSPNYFLSENGEK